jgi:hypothetical protein
MFHITGLLEGYSKISIWIIDSSVHWDLVFQSINTSGGRILRGLVLTSRARRVGGVVLEAYCRIKPVYVAQRIYTSLPHAQE